MTVYHNYLAIIGRAAGDDESTAETYEHTTVEKASNLFRQNVRELFSDPPERHLAPNHEVFIDFVLVSESPITVEVQNV